MYTFLAICIGIGATTLPISRSVIFSAFFDLLAGGII